MGFFKQETAKLEGAKQAFVDRLNHLLVENDFMVDGETANIEELKRDVNMPNICGIKRKGNEVFFIDAEGEERIVSGDNLTSSELAALCAYWQTWYLVKDI